MSTETIERIEAACAQYNLPSESLVEYVQHGTDPGHFLGAVLESNLSAAARYADGFNSKRLYEWAQVMHYGVPYDSQGSAERVAKWMKLGGLIGRNIAEEKRARALRGAGWVVRS